MSTAITHVQPGSIAQRLGLVAGDKLVSIAGEPIIDQIDYQALTAQERFDMMVEDAGGQTRTVHVRKEDWEPLGLTLDQTIVSKPRPCRNHCIFCFIDQMPPGMRKTLYVKDDDWRLSLMMGNYITMTNIDDHELDRIIRRKVSPLFVSVQCTDPDMRVKLLRNGNFWLNETPDTPKLGWDAACIRICTWGEFEQKDTKFRFYYFNLHMDHVGVVARREGAKLVVKKIKEIAKGAPVVLTGDFNVDQNNEIYEIFTKSGVLKDSYVCSRLRFAENGTFNSFDSNLKTDSRIDHVFVSPSFDVDRYGVLTNVYWTPAKTSGQSSVKGKDAPQEISFDKYDRRTPSDHYPVLVKMHYAGK